MQSTAAVFVFVLLAVGSLAQTDRPADCKPGETKKVDCNTCFCTTKGIWGCTLMACAPLQIVPTTGKKATRVRRYVVNCTPGTTFKKDCNPCFCNRHGTLAVCLREPCPRRSTNELS